mmetsp:Transcript_27181/g.48041  ORF Transcript_27181/g.48041 Transcript_27181/m.48041 type:complete len:858 (-) Transcript_27181:85-2658(-)
MDLSFLSKIALLALATPTLAVWKKTDSKMSAGSDVVAVAKDLPSDAINMALRGRASQSTFVPGSGAFARADRAIDGNKNSNFNSLSCTHTNQGYDLWWKVVLPKVSEIFQIDVTNRGDCCPERLNGFSIWINGTKVLTPGNIPAGRTHEYNLIDFFGTSYFADEVKITVPDSNGILTLCEVQVWGYPYTPSPTSSPITGVPTGAPVTTVPTTTVPTMAPATTVPTEYGKCPPGSNLLIKAADDGAYSWTDANDVVFDIVNPDRIDNAGFYESAGWTRRPKVAPARTTLADIAYVAGDTTPVRFILSDQYGNKEFCTINVQVNDDEGPKISFCPNGGTVNVDTQCKAQLQWNVPTMTDNQPEDVRIEGPFGTSGGSTAADTYTGAGYDTGSHPIHYRGYDLADNTIDCNFTMTVTDIIEPAYSTCETAQASYIHQCGGLLGSDVDVPVTWTCTATDNCPSPGTLVTPDCDPWVEIVSFAGEGFHNDAPTQNATACDAATDTTDKCEELWNSNGNLTFCAFDSETGCIEATDKIDAFGDDTKYYFRGTNGDSFPVPPIILNTTDSHSATTYKVSCLATDVHGNTKSKDFQFEVADGRKKPHFTYCPADSTLTLPEDGTVHTMPALFSLPTWQNNAGCQADTTMEEASGMGPTTGLHAGVHAFSYRLYDTWGNEAYCNFQVTVLDKNNLTWANCPTDQVLETDADLLQYQIAGWIHPTVEKRGKTMTAANVTITEPEAKSGMAFPLGVTKLTYTVEDLREHMSDVTPVTCEFTIEVKDREKPEFTGKSEIPACAEGENGVPQGSFCGGQQITITKRNTGSPDDFMYNAAYSVSDISTKSCCGGFTCQSFTDGNEYVKVCK